MKSEPEIRAQLATWLDPSQPIGRDYDKGLVVGFLTALSQVLGDSELETAARIRCNQVIAGTRDIRANPAWKGTEGNYGSD